MRRDRGLRDGLQRRTEWQGQAVAQLSGPLGAARRIDRDHQHMRARFLRAPHQIETDPVIVLGEPIELEPGHVGGERDQFFERNTADCACGVWNTCPLRGFRQKSLGARPEHALQSHRRDADRRRIGAAEQGNLGRYRPTIGADPRHHLDGVERLGVALHCKIMSGPAGDGFIAERWDAPLGGFAHVLDGRKAASQFRLARGARYSPAGRRGFHGCAVMHASFPQDRIVSEMAVRGAREGKRRAVRSNKKRRPLACQ